MVFIQCPDLAEFRSNISQFIVKILKSLPYQYAYVSFHVVTSTSFLFSGFCSTDARCFQDSFSGNQGLVD